MCPIFVTYKKSKNIDVGLKYDDKSLSKELFSWMARPGVNLQNEDVNLIKN
ncbi:DUF3427 domain-containing protein [Aminipila sp.]|uniref:DUF3427 domain-containing protein n=1 Tax=Aminipila sp. TaxID=2060095 RepID=UPI003FA4A496